VALAAFAMLSAKSSANMRGQGSIDIGWWGYHNWVCRLARLARDAAGRMGAQPFREAGSTDELTGGGVEGGGVVDALASGILERREDALSREGCRTFGQARKAQAFGQGKAEALPVCCSPTLS
jgi:hypothetical protein